MSRLTGGVRTVVSYSAVALARLGLIDEERGKRIADLAWPRVAYGLARKSQTTADLAMVGWAIGPAAIAGLGFAFAFWQVASAVGWSFASGTMAFFSQRIGADDQEGLDLAVKQTLWILLAATSTLAILFVVFADALIAILGAAPEPLAYAATYLQIVAASLIFNTLSQVGSRVLLSANDAWTPLGIRGVGALGNIALNAFFIFGLEMGVAGAALGTFIASASTGLILLIGILRGQLPLIGSLPVKINVGPPYIDIPLMKEILEVGTPVVGKQFVSKGANFAMLAILAYFGTIVVAAYALAREIRILMNTPAWGINTASRSLVGQELGNEDEREAEAYGWDLLRFAVVVYVFMSITMFAFAERIAPLFTSDPQAIAVAVPFIMVMAISLLGLGIDSAASGVIGAAGDTRVPLYARLVGLYVFMLPIAYLGVPTRLGLLAVYIAITAEAVVPAVITYYRFTSNRWKAVSRQYRLSTTD